MHNDDDDGVGEEDGVTSGLGGLGGDGGDGGDGGLCGLGGLSGVKSESPAGG